MKINKNLQVSARFLYAVNKSIFLNSHSGHFTSLSTRNKILQTAYKKNTRLLKNFLQNRKLIAVYFYGGIRVSYFRKIDKRGERALLVSDKAVLIDEDLLLNIHLYQLKQILNN